MSGSLSYQHRERELSDAMLCYMLYFLEKCSDMNFKRTVYFNISILAKNSESKANKCLGHINDASSLANEKPSAHGTGFPL